MNKRGKIGKWITILIFIAAIIFIALLTKNKGNFAETIADIKGFFGK